MLKWLHVIRWKIFASKIVTAFHVDGSFPDLHLEYEELGRISRKLVAHDCSLGTRSLLAAYRLKKLFIICLLSFYFMAIRRMIKNNFEALKSSFRNPKSLFTAEILILQLALRRCDERR